MVHIRNLGLYLSLIVWLQSYSQTSNPVELGKVNWLRELNHAKQVAEEKAKPILILFQEVPGCLTCQRYGQEVLSHPLIVESLESLFVPLAIFNNRKGRDSKVLEMYQEPSWNDPVLRVVNAKGETMLPRYAGDYTPQGVVNYLIDALQVFDISVPQYLDLVYEELSSCEQRLTATMGMFCFWTGEKVYGGIHGVIDSEAGFIRNREVVRVNYDPNLVSLEELIKAGSQADCAEHIFLESGQEKSLKGKISADRMKPSGDFIPDKNPKYYLSRTHFAAVPMSPIQALKANHLIGSGKSPEWILSPIQNRMANHILRQDQRKWKNLIGSADWKEQYFQLKNEILIR